MTRSSRPISAALTLLAILFILGSRTRARACDAHRSGDAHSSGDARAADFKGEAARVHG
jgi:hypothetical protein